MSCWVVEFMKPVSQYSSLLQISWNFCELSCCFCLRCSPLRRAKRQHEIVCWIKMMILWAAADLNHSQQQIFFLCRKWEMTSYFAHWIRQLTVVMCTRKLHRSTRDRIYCCRMRIKIEIFLQCSCWPEIEWIRSNKGKKYTTWAKLKAIKMELHAKCKLWIAARTQ